jgi:hypothetical protein
LRRSGAQGRACVGVGDVGEQQWEWEGTGYDGCGRGGERLAGCGWELGRELRWMRRELRWMRMGTWGGRRRWEDVKRR